MIIKRLFLISVLALLLDIASPIALAQDPTGARYAPRGPYTVGVRDFVIKGDPYPLNVTVWYPALDAEGIEPASYQVLFLSLDGEAIPDAPPDSAQAPYPLVVFSHGAGSFRAQSVYLTEHLASYGMVVVAADHPGNTLPDFVAQVLSPDSLAALSSGEGNFENQFGQMLLNEDVRTMMAANFAERPFAVLREIDFADTLSAEGGALVGMIDTDRTAVIGHSAGGYTALAAAGARLDFDALAQWCSRPTEVMFDPAADPAFSTAPFAVGTDDQTCYLTDLADDIARRRGLDSAPAGLWPPTSDPRIRAAVVLAPYNGPIFGPAGLATLTVPLMVQVGSGDTIAAPGRDAYAMYTQAGSADKALVVLEGAGHMVFVDRQVTLLGGDPVWNLETAQALINHFATAFLLSVFDGDAEAAAALDPAEVSFAGIGYDRQVK
jgi:predicted dienelactone hydrolase